MSITTLIDRLAFLQGIEYPTDDEINEMDSIEDELDQMNEDDVILRHGGEEW